MMLKTLQHRLLRWARRPVLRGLGVACLALIPTAPALGKAYFRLVPTPPAPYAPGQVVTVDVYVDNQEAFALPLTTLRLDFTDTDPTVTLPAQLTWQITSAQAPNANLPVPQWTDISTTPANVVPAHGTLRVATLTVTLPAVAGCHVLDAFNRDEPATQLGAILAYLPAPNVRATTWRAYHGQLLDGAEGFPISTATGAEQCNGVDDDCDGLVDEDFWVEVYNPFVDEEVLVGEGAACRIGAGDCAVLGAYQCSRNTLVCVGPSPGSPSAEGPYLHQTCFDGHDNDCDSLVDWEDPDCAGAEICDYLDNDGNGVVDDPYPELGQPCTKGIGVCAATGVFVCASDGSGVECTAEPYLVRNEVEGWPGHPHCADGLDNDCDDRIDLKDPDCQEPESCDGADNDGDEQIDENWPALGQLCTVGVGECQRIGQIECNAAGTGTQCSVTPGAATPEGPGCDCGDTLDNDCDGLTDLADPDCGAFVFRARAALPNVCAVDGDCSTWRRIQFDTLNGGPGVTVEAELVAMDSNGVILGTLPVAQGDTVRFTSRSDPAEYQLATQQLNLNAPLVRDRWMNCTQGPGTDVSDTPCFAFDTDCDRDVDLRDAAALMRAFPGPIRFHLATAPITLLRVRADNGFAKVSAYASPYPQVHVWHPDDTTVLVNQGDRILMDVATPEIDPASLTLRLDGVDVFAALGIDPATDLPGGPYGGSVALPNGCTADICELVVDTADSTALAGHSMRMVVEGMCCGGHLFAATGTPTAGAGGAQPAACEVDDGHDRGLANAFQLNIFTPTEDMVDPAAPVAVAGSICHGLPLATPANAPAKVELNGLGVQTSAPTIAPGDGLLTADRYTYGFITNLPETDLYAEFSGLEVPGTVDEGSGYLVATATDPRLNAVSERVRMALGPLDTPSAARGSSAGVPHGLTLAITDAALTAVIQRALNAMLPALVQEFENMVEGFQGKKLTIPTSGPCDPVVTLLPPFFPPPIFIPPALNQFVVDVVPQNDRIDITINVPQTRAVGPIFGRCEIEGLFGECFIDITVFVSLDVKIKKARLLLSATEDDLIAGAAIVPVIDIQPQDLEISIADFGSDVGCWGGTLLEILSFGVVGVVVDAYVEGLIEDEIADLDVTQFLGMIPVPPIPLDFLDIDPVDLAALDVTLHLDRTEVEITPDGLAVGLATDFVPHHIDPEVAVMPGLPTTQTPLPQPVLPSPALGATLLVSDDAVNRMLYALTRNGLIKTQYEDVRTIPDLLPANCATLAAPLRGQCVAMKGLNCLGLSGAALSTCLATEVVLDELNIGPTTPLIFHGRLDAPPKFYIGRNPTPQTIVSNYRLSQVQVTVLADRDGDGVYSGQVGAAPSCFGDNPGTQTACVLWTGCFDVNVEVLMTLTTPAGVPQIGFSVTDVQLSEALNCGGGTGFPAGFEGLEDVFAGQVFSLLNAKVDSIPPLSLEGLDFGNIMVPLNLRVLNQGNAYHPQFKDYFGITADPN